MLTKRLLHRWVLMNEAGGGDGGGTAVGGAGASTGVAGGSSGADSNAATSGVGAASGASVSASTPTSSQAAGAEGANPSASLEPPAALTDEPKPADPATPAEPDKPIEYADFKLPEGVEVSAEALAAFKEAAAGAKLSQEQAQSFIDMHQKAIDAASTKPYEMWRDTQKQWQDTIKADPEFGGAKLETETLPAVARAIKQFSPNADAEKALRQAFSFTGAGNNPEVIRFIARIGMTLKEGTHVGGYPAGGDGGKSAASKLYPSAGPGSQGQS